MAVMMMVIREGVRIRRGLSLGLSRGQVGLLVV